MDQGVMQTCYSATQTTEIWMDEQMVLEILERFVHREY